MVNVKNKQPALAKFYSALHTNNHFCQFLTGFRQAIHFCEITWTIICKQAMVAAYRYQDQWQFTHLCKNPILSSRLLTMCIFI